MNRISTTIFLFLCILTGGIGLPSTARAAVAAPASSADAANASPIRISKCTSYFLLNLGKTTVESGANFENVAKKPITDLLFQFTLYDPFGDSIGSFYKMVQGTFSPGVFIQHTHAVSGWNVPMWETPIGEVRNLRNGKRAIRFAGDPPTIGRTTCTVLAARFSDGTIWKEPGFVRP